VAELVANYCKSWVI